MKLEYNFEYHDRFVLLYNLIIDHENDNKLEFRIEVRF
jgi:hypothetical protein